MRPKGQGLTFPLSLGPAQGRFVSTGQGQIWLVVVGCVFAGVYSEAPFRAPCLQSAWRCLTLSQGRPVGQEVIAIHICEARHVTGAPGLTPVFPDTRDPDSVTPVPKDPSSPGCLH